MLALLGEARIQMKGQPDPLEHSSSRTIGLAGEFEAFPRGSILLASVS